MAWRKQCTPRTWLVPHITDIVMCCNHWIAVIYSLGSLETIFKHDLIVLTPSFLIKRHSNMAWWPWCTPRTWLVSHITDISVHFNHWIDVDTWFRIVWSHSCQTFFLWGTSRPTTTSYGWKHQPRTDHVPLYMMYSSMGNLQQKPHESTLESGTAPGSPPNLQYSTILSQAHTQCSMDNRRQKLVMPSLTVWTHSVSLSFCTPWS